MPTYIIKTNDEITEDELEEILQRAIADKKDVWWEYVDVKIIQVS